MRRPFSFRKRQPYRHVPICGAQRQQSRFDQSRRADFRILFRRRDHLDGLFLRRRGQDEILHFKLIFVHRAPQRRHESRRQQVKDKNHDHRAERHERVCLHIFEKDARSGVYRDHFIVISRDENGNQLQKQRGVVKRRNVQSVRLKRLERHSDSVQPGRRKHSNEQ